MNDIRRVLSYNDVLLCPRYSGLMHTSDANIDFEYNKLPLPFTTPPIINSPMDKVCSVELLRYLHNELNFPVSIHRYFQSPQDQLRFLESCEFTGKDLRKVFIGVGSIYKWKEWIDYLLSQQHRSKTYKYHTFSYLIDMANGDTPACIDTIKYIREHAPDYNIMAGNVATKSGYIRLEEAGANFIRCGIGGGSICATRINTGFGIPTLTTVLDCNKVKTNSYLIADGGIEYNGDICKTLVAGADMVMMGKMFAATSLAPGIKLNQHGQITTKENEYKWVEYNGMASKVAQANLKSNKAIKSIEGVSGFVPYSGKTEEVIPGVLENLKTAMAYYGGCTNWEQFKKRIKFIEITPSGWEESKTRIKE